VITTLAVRFVIDPDVLLTKEIVVGLGHGRRV
jgi:hypothetical protein